MSNDDDNSPPAAEPRPPWKRPAPVVGGRRNVAPRAGAARPVSNPAPAAAPPPKPVAQPVASTPSSNGDPARPWWKRRAPVVGGRRKPEPQPVVAPAVAAPEQPAQPDAPPDVTSEDLAAADLISGLLSDAMVGDHGEEAEDQDGTEEGPAAEDEEGDEDLLEDLAE